MSKIDIAQARETQFLRISLEIEVTRTLIAIGNPALLEEARQTLDKQKQALAAQDLNSFSASDRAFHRALFHAAQVPELWNLVTERSGHIDRLRKLNLPDPGKAADIIHYHQNILDAVLGRDVVKAEAEVRGHLTGTLASVGSITERHPEYF